MDGQMTLGEEIDSLLELKRQKAAFEAQAKEVEAMISTAEKKLLERMDADGVSRAAGSSASVYVDESIYPSVTDWDAFYKYIQRNGYYHLLERRPSVPGCRELFERDVAGIPGVEAYTKRRPKVSPLKTR